MSVYSLIPEIKWRPPCWSACRLLLVNLGGLINDIIEGKSLESRIFTVAALSSAIFGPLVYATTQGFNMPINTSEMMYVLSTLAEHQNLRVAITESMKCGAVVGLSTVVGGILLGPLGIAVGGTLGSLFAAFKSHGQFKSVARVIVEDMTPLQQTQLAASCLTVLRDVRIEDVAVLLPLLLNTPSLQQAVMTRVISYVSKEMQLKIID